jgi:hypothetical protein
MLHAAILRSPIAHGLHAAVDVKGCAPLAARDLGIDSAEMRRRNLIGAAEMPYRLPRLEPGGPAVDTECDSRDYPRPLSAA